MPKRSQISLCEFILRHPFYQSTKPISLNPQILTKPIPTRYHRFSNSASTPQPLLHNPTLKIQSLPHPVASTRSLSSESSSSELDQNKEVDKINMKFVEAREEIDMAMESKETVYFDEEAECARAAVKEVLDMFEGLLAKLSDKERGALQRSMGMKIEQLKAELQQLDE